MKSIITQVVNHSFQKIIKIKPVSKYESAYCNIKRREWGNDHLVFE